MTTTVTLTGLTTTIFADDGLNQVLRQVASASGDCWIEGGMVVKVVVSDGGIVFADGGTTLIRPEGWVITHLCDLIALAKQIESDQEARDEQIVHLHAA